MPVAELDCMALAHAEFVVVVVRAVAAEEAGQVEAAEEGQPSMALAVLAVLVVTLKVVAEPSTPPPSSFSPI